MKGKEGKGVMAKSWKIDNSRKRDVEYIYGRSEMAPSPRARQKNTVQIDRRRSTRQITRVFVRVPKFTDNGATVDNVAADMPSYIPTTNQKTRVEPSLTTHHALCDPICSWFLSSAFFYVCAYACMRTRKRTPLHFSRLDENAVCARAYVYQYIPSNSHDKVARKYVVEILRISTLIVPSRVNFTFLNVSNQINRMGYNLRSDVVDRMLQIGYCRSDIVDRMFDFYLDIQLEVLYYIKIVQILSTKL